MNERQWIKAALAPELPDPEKVYDACIRQTAPVRRGRVLKRLVPAVACAAVLAVAALSPALLRPERGIQTAPAPKQETSASHGQSAGAPNGQQEDIGALMQKVHFNALADDAQGDQRMLWFDPEKTHTRQMTQEEVFGYLGGDIRPSSVPRDLAYLPAERMYEIIYNNDGTVAFDHFIFSYYTKENGGDHRWMQLTVSRTSVKSDCVYVFSEQMRSSEIGGRQMKIGERKMGHGPYTIVEDGPNIPAGYHDLFVAEFSAEGVQYQAVGSNVTREEFVRMLASIPG